jgi:hypothetical protein
MNVEGPRIQRSGSEALSDPGQPACEEAARSQKEQSGAKSMHR